MASDKTYLCYVLDLLIKIQGVTYKKMMREYLLYKDNLLFGGIYDNRFLVKKTPSLSKYCLTEELPYSGAKPMLLIDTENPEFIKEIVLNICLDLTK